VIRLGLRLALAGGRGSAIGVALAAFAVALGTAVLLFALSFLPALEDRTTRDAWRAPAPAADRAPADGSLLWAAIGDRYDGQPFARILVAPLSAPAPLPPGIPRLPRAGEAFVSPALARLIASVPPDQVGNRVGLVAGTIGDRALRSPDELVAVVGADESTLRSIGGSIVTEFPTGREPHELPPLAVLLVTLAVAGALAPVGVFVATATRLSATRREQRLAALRLVGATPVQAIRLATVEALLSTTLGAVGGVALFFLLRPLVAQIPLGQTTWWPDAILPPILPALALLAAVPVVGVAAATIGLRRLTVSPLGVQRRATPAAPRALRIVPLTVATGVLLFVLAAFRGEATSNPALLVVVGLAFAGVIGGIAYAGPWLTTLVGRILARLPRGGAATLLAARRLVDDPRGSFGAIAGVVMAVFVATAFLSFAGVARVQAGAGSSVETRPGRVVASLSQGAELPESLPARLAELPGVTGVLPVRGAQVPVDQSPIFAWVAPCAEVTTVLDLPGLDCAAGRILVRPGLGGLAAGSYTLVSDNLPSGASQAVTAPLVVRARDLGDGPASWTGGRLPDLIVDPALLPAAGRSLPVTMFYVATDGSIAAQERVRTAISAADPGAWVRTAAEQVTTNPLYDELGRVIVLGLLGTMALAGCSLAVAVTTSIADRRRQFALLRSAGMPASSLRRLVLLQAGAPLVGVATFSAALGVGITQAILRLANAQDVPAPDLSVAVVVVASIGVAMLVVLLALPLLERLTRPETLRTE